MADTPPTVPPAAEPPVSAPPAPPATPPASQAEDWRAAIKDPEAKKFAENSTDIEHLAKRGLELRAKLSTAIVKPAKDAKPEDIAAYRKAIGVPETPEGYKFEMPEGREATETDKKFQAEWAKAFHEDEVPAELASKINKRWNAFVLATEKAQIEADKQYAQQTEAELRREWPGEEYEKNRKHAERFAAKYAGSNFEGLRQIETKSGQFVLDHPVVMRTLAAAGREMSEDRTFGRVMSDGDRQSAEARAKEIHGKIDEAMAKNDHDTANRLDQELQEIHRNLAGSKPIVGAQLRVA